jgi:hypothetical protein
MKAAAAVLLLVAACSAPAPTPTISQSAAPTVTPTPTPTPAPTPTQIPTPTPDLGYVVMAAGDIACDPVDPNFNGGLGTSTACRQQDTANLLVGADLILALGDNQYECGGLAAYLASFDLSWGAFKSLTRPSIGNHERDIGGPIRVGTDCNPQSSAGYYTYFGSAAPADTYSFDAGTWHFATVDTTCSLERCLAQAAWLSADLAAHPTPCSLVFYHHPRWSSGVQGGLVQRDPFWRATVAAGVEIVLNGHDHDYERFAPMDGDGAGSAVGVREFVVGTGGFNLLPLPTIQPNSEVRNGETFGVLKLTLYANSYAWQFIPIAGQSFTDEGTGTCH